MLRAAKRNAPEPQVGSRTEASRMACQKARRSSGPSLWAMTSLAKRSTSRLRVMRSFTTSASPDASLARTSCVTLAAGDDFAPRLRGQRVVVRRGGVPAAALRYVVNARGDVVGQVKGRFQAHGVFRLPGVPRDAVAHGGVDVSVRVVPQQAPDAAVRPEGHGTLLAGGVKQEGDDRAAPNVAGDVLLGVVSAHLLLVDVLLKNVAKHVRVNLVVLPVGPLVQVPAVAVKEVGRRAQRRRPVWRLRGCPSPTHAGRRGRR